MKETLINLSINILLIICVVVFLTILYDRSSEYQKQINECRSKGGIMVEIHQSFARTSSVCITGLEIVE